MKSRTIAAIVAMSIAVVLGLAVWAFSPANDVVVRTLVYGPQGQKADIYQAAAASAAARRPAVLLIHGGGWSGGGRKEFRDLARGLARQGMVAIAIDYRLVPGARWPDPARDVEHAVWWVREHADSLQIDPQRVTAVGGSAGGHLAAWLATTNRVNAKGTPSRVDRMVSFWGPWDLAAPGLHDDAQNMVAALMAGQPPRDASPLLHIDAESAPALLIHGARDELIPPDQSTRACEALRAVRVECELMLLDGEAHGFTSGNTERPAEVARRVHAFITRGRKS
jgi:acetyl esterase/lipase